MRDYQMRAWCDSLMTSLMRALDPATRASFPDFLHAHGHFEMLPWSETYAVLSECGVFYKDIDEFDCTVGIDYMLIWFKGTVFGGVDDQADFMDPNKLALMRM